MKKIISISVLKYNMENKSKIWMFFLLVLSASYSISFVILRKTKLLAIISSILISVRSHLLESFTERHNLFYALFYEEFLLFFFIQKFPISVIA